MDLSQYVAHKTEIRLERLGIDITINPFSLLDDAWMQNEFSEDRLKEIFEDLGNQENINDLMRIVYHQLDNDSKLMLANDVKPFEIDEDGEKKELKMNGPDKLKYVISGPAELMQVLNGLAKAKGISEPLLEQLAKAEESTEKKSKATRKKKPTGRK